MWDDKLFFKISKRWNLAGPPLAFTRNQNMGKRLENGNWQNRWIGNMPMGKCKKKPKKSCIAQTNHKYFQGGFGRLQLGNVYTFHGFLQRTHESKEVDYIIFFYKLVRQFVDRGFGNT